MTDEFITDHRFQGASDGECTYVTSVSREGSKYYCTERASAHADPRPADHQAGEDFLSKHPHHFVPQKLSPQYCDYRFDLGGTRFCGYPEQLHRWAEYDQYMVETAGRARVGCPTCGSPDPRRHPATQSEGEVVALCPDAWHVDPKIRARGTSVVRKADVAQYERPPMPDAARLGPVVTLIDAPVDPLGTLAVICGIYTGKVRRSKAEVTDEERRAMLADMQATVLDGPLESMQFTFLVEGVSRSIANQMTRNRFAFFAQESLRFAVAEDWAQEVPLPPSLLSAGEGSPAVGVWRKALNAAEDAYDALIGAGMPAEEARGVLPLDITTRLYWTVNLRALITEAGKRTCTQAQFPWRQIFGGVAKALRERGSVDLCRWDDRPEECDEFIEKDHRPKPTGGWEHEWPDAWQYRAFADLLRPVCYRQGKCGFMAKFDRGCTIRARVDAFERAGIPSTHWAKPPNDPDALEAIDPREWAADPAAARVVGDA